MQTTLIIIKNEKGELRYTAVHSNHHFLKIIKNIVDYFKYDFIGNKVGKKYISSKEIEKKIFDLVHPFEIMPWKPFKSINHTEYFDTENDEANYSNYILMNIKNDKKWGCNTIWMDIQNTETDLEEEKLLWDRFNYRLKQLKKMK